MSYSIASSAIWLIITAVLWGTAAGLFMNERGGGMCGGEAIISRCRQTQTVEALAWTEFALCVLTLLAACFWVRRSKRSYVRLCFSFITPFTDSLSSEALTTSKRKDYEIRKMNVTFCNVVSRTILYPTVMLYGKLQLSIITFIASRFATE